MDLPGVCCGSDTNKFVGAAVIKEPFAATIGDAFNEDDVGNLTGFFPVAFRLENRFIAAIDEFARIMAIKNSDTGAIDQMVVGAIVNQHDALGSENGRRPRLDDARIEFSGAAG